MKFSESEKTYAAEALMSMVEPAREERSISIENPNVPVTPETLASILGYGSTRAGVQVNEHNALMYTAVFAAIRILAESVGMLPIIVYEGDEDSNERERAKWHPAYSLLRRQPNSEMTATVFKETIQGHLGAWGNGYARILFDNSGNAKELVPLLPDRTRADRYAGQLKYVSRGNGGEEVFDPEEILHIPAFGFNGLRGYSPIGHARQSIGLGIAAETFGATFFGNGAEVGAVLEHPGRLPDRARDNLRESWNRMHQGPDSAHQIAILEEGMKYTRIGIPPEDAQFLETRKFQVNEIARLYRIPPHMLGDLSGSTNNNIEQQALEFLVYTLTPWLEKWEAEINRKLFRPDSGYFAKFDERKLLRTNSAARQAYYAAGRQWGYLSANDIRKEEDMPPITGGDVYLSPVNMTTSERLIQDPPPPAGQGTNNPANDSRATALRDVFADAIGRMLRKEMNAAGRGKADERFYAEHRQHVAESIMPAARSVARLLDRPLDHSSLSLIEPIIAGFSEKRHEAVGDPAMVAGEEAAALTDQLIAALEKKL
ncbi:MAG: phage portal protein [Phycisphaerae bacterium]|nr:phage portal protein [Phycisphaerae bacterium]